MFCNKPILHTWVLKQVYMKSRFGLQLTQWSDKVFSKPFYFLEGIILFLSYLAFFAEDKLGASIFPTDWSNCLVIAALSKQYLEHQNSHEVGAVLESTEWPKQLAGIPTLPGKSFDTCDDLFMHVSKMSHSKTEMANRYTARRQWGGKELQPEIPSPSVRQTAAGQSQATFA